MLIPKDARDQVGTVSMCSVINLVSIEKVYKIGMKVPKRYNPNTALAAHDPLLLHA